jgi:hypothetical protein
MLFVEQLFPGLAERTKAKGFLFALRVHDLNAAIPSGAIVIGNERRPLALNSAN